MIYGRNYFTFAGKNCKDFNVYVSGQGTYNAPARVYSTYEIPGRNGDLYIDEKRFENIELTYPAFIFEDMITHVDGLRNYLLSQKGYQRLEDTYHPDEYRMAVFSDGFEFDVDPRHEVSTFDITFRCKPQRFLKSGEKTITLTANGPVYNPTLQEAKPLIRVYGTGVLGIGSESITISAANTYTDIDCEMMDCFKGSENRNSYVTFTDHNFPTLKPGNTNFALNSGISKVEIIPRWWRL